MELLLFAAYIITVHHGLLCYVNQLSGPKSHVSIAKQPINNVTVNFGLNAVHDHACGRCLSISRCKQTGLYFKRLDKHLKRSHPGKTRKDNFSCPSPTHKNRCLVKNSDQKRKACQVVGCRFYGVLMTRLDRHMKKTHPEEMKISSKQTVAECSFSSEDDLEDDFVTAKIEEILAKL